MKIVLLGQASFGQAVLEKFLSERQTVVGVFCPPDEHNKPEPLRIASESLGVPAFQFRRLRDEQAKAKFRSLDADICVMAYVTDIVPMEMLRVPTLGAIQYHPSLLPKHRGPSSMNWAIIAGETETGVSIFWPDEGLDTGDILLQRSVPIEPSDTLGSLYFNKLFPLGVEILAEALDMVGAGNAPKIAQDHSLATYEGWCTADDAVVDWTLPTRKIFDLIRGCDPRPGANIRFEDSRVSLFSASIVDSYPRSVPCEILDVDDEGFVVATSDGAIRVGRVKVEGEAKMLGGEWAKRVGLSKGSALA